MELHYTNNGLGWQACEINPLVKMAGDNSLANKTPAEIRDFIVNFEYNMSFHELAEKGDNDRCPLKHSFAPGVYVREIFIPKGTILVGKIHKHEHPNFVMSGDVSVLTEQGGVERIKAPLSIISPAGTKRIVYAHEDTVWVTIHVTDKTDIDEIEEDIIAKDYTEYMALESQKEILWLGLP